MKSIQSWISRNKKPILFGLFSAGLFVISYCIIKEDYYQLSGIIGKEPCKNYITNDNIASYCKEQTINSGSISTKCPHQVSKHIRNLPEGWHASSNKVNDAICNGYVLENNQTWVKEYYTGRHSA